MVSGAAALYILIWFGSVAGGGNQGRASESGEGGDSLTGMVILLCAVQRRPTCKVSFFREGSLWILSFGVPSRPNPSSGGVNSTLLGPREGSSILNVDRAVVAAAVVETQDPVEVEGDCVLSQRTSTCLLSKAGARWEVPL